MHRDRYFEMAAEDAVGGTARRRPPVSRMTNLTYETYDHESRQNNFIWRIRHRKYYMERAHKSHGPYALAFSYRSPLSNKNAFPRICY